MADRGLFSTDPSVNPFVMSEGQPTETKSGAMVASEIYRAPRDALFGLAPEVYMAPEAKQYLGQLASDTGSSLSSAFAFDTFAQTDVGKGMIDSMASAAQQGVDWLNSEEGQTAINFMEGSEFWFPFVRSMGGARGFLQSVAQNLTNNMKKSADADFYKNPKLVAEDLRAKHPEWSDKTIDLSSKAVAGLSQFKATSMGFAEGVKNALRQSFTAQGQAEANQRGVSLTLTDLIRSDAPDNIVFGQAGYENLIGTQMGNLSPILKQLDDEFFTHKSVLNLNEFKGFMKGLPDEDAEAMWRTMMANQKITRNEDFVMIGRQPTQRSKSGQLQYLALNKGKVPKALPQLFPLSKPFDNGPEFINAYKKAGESMDEGRANAIRWAFVNNKRLSEITDPAELKAELQATVDKAPSQVRGKGVSKFSVTDFVNKALYNTDQASFKDNDTLAKTLEKRFAGVDGVTILRNRKQADRVKNGVDNRDVFIVTSETSDAYELGAVNIIYRVKKDGTMTAMINDVNDIAIAGTDVNMPGAKKAIVIVPPMTRNMRTGVKETMDLPPESGALKKIKEELMTPAEPTARDRREAALNVGLPAAQAVRAMTDGQGPASPFDIIGDDTQVQSLEPDGELMGTNPFEL